MKVQYGCAPINWTNDDLPSLGGELTYQQCLSEMALAGFKGSEGGCKYPKDLKVMQKALDLRGLTVCNMWFSSFFTTFQTEETIKAFKEHMDYTYELGARVIGVGECGVTIHGDESKSLRGERPILSDDQFKCLTNGLNTLGQLAKEKGMKVCFHPHVGTGIESLDEINRLMEETDPELVFLLFDTGHSIVAGENPVEILEKYIDRVGHIHVKDVRGAVLEQLDEEKWSFLKGVKNGMFTVPGDGTRVEWNRVFDIIKKSDYEGWIVVEAEQDPAQADPLEYAIKARKYMKEQLGI